MIELIIGFIISFFEKIVVKRLLYPGIFASIFFILLGLTISLLGVNAVRIMIHSNHFIEEKCYIEAFENNKRDISHCVEKSFEMGQETKGITYKKTLCDSTCMQYKVRYQVNNHTVSNIARESPFSDTCSLNQDILNKYITGQTYFCWRDPTNENEVLLDRGHIVTSPLYIALGALLVIWTLYRKFISPKPSEIRNRLLTNTLSSPKDELQIEIVSLMLKSYMLGPYIKLLRIIAFMGVLIGIGLLISIPYKIYDNWRVNHAFIKTTCKVDSKDSSRRLLLLSYPVKTLQYRTWMSTDNSPSSKKIIPEMIDQITLNASFRCWYDPHQPRDIFLEKPISSYWTSIILSLVIIFLCVVFITCTNKIREMGSLKKR